VKLLAVEDEPRIAAFLAKGLRAHGYEVGWASTGKRCSSAASQVSR
jgi:DNA-binding response OmpR family regulator